MGCNCLGALLLSIRMYGVNANIVEFQDFNNLNESTTGVFEYLKGNFKLLLLFTDKGKLLRQGIKSNL